MAKRLGCYLFQLKNDEEFIGIYAKNRIEWLLTDFACIYQGITSVPLYEMLQPDSLEAVFSEVPIRIIACSENLVNNLLKFKNEGKVPFLAHIIIFEKISEEILLKANQANVTLHSFYDIINSDLEGQDHPPTPDSIFTICYTSGTTGRRKGAKIAHKNLVATIAGILNNNFSFNSDDCHLSYLPLTHMLERLAVYTIIQCGAKIGLYGGDSLKIRNDLVLLKPTIFISVPRLFNRIYELIIQQFNSSTGLNKMLIGKALGAKMSNYHNYQQIASTVWDKLVFENVRKTLGGKIRFMVTGSAPITGEVLTFLRVVFSCPIVEGYGQTESCAASFVTLPQDLECGHIGGPLPNLEAKIIDVPEMKYLTNDLDVMGNKAPRGELCIRGPTVFVGYYQKNDNEEVLDQDG